MYCLWLGTINCRRALPDPDLLFEFSLKREGLSLAGILEIKSLLLLFGMGLNSSKALSPPTDYDLCPAYWSSIGPDWSSKSSSIFFVILIFLTTSSNGGCSALTALERLLLIIDVSSSIV